MFHKAHTLILINITILTLWFLIYVLYIGSSLLIPFVLAVFLSFIIISVSSAFQKRGIPKPLSFIFTLILLGSIFYAVAQIINTNIGWIISQAPEYEQKLLGMFTRYSEKYDLNAWKMLENGFQSIDFSAVLTGLASIATSIVKNAGLILMFTIFILLESKVFEKKIGLITGWEKSRFFDAVKQIQEDMKSYFMIKTITSICIALLSALIMFFFGLDFFIFWAFLIFLLNYIPNIGSIIAVTFPVLFSLVQFESLALTSVFLFLMTASQLFIWSFIEPRLMWNKLNLSPLVILFSLIFWWMVWWPIGMLLSVPIMVMVNITLAHIDATRPIAIFLSEKWIIKFQPEKRKKTKIGLWAMKKLLKK